MAVDQNLPQDEVMEILEFGVSRKWQQEMTRHGFDPATQTVSQFVSFCERLESTEPTDAGTTNPRKRKKTW